MATYRHVFIVSISFDLNGGVPRMVFDVFGPGRRHDVYRWRWRWWWWYCRRVWILLHRRCGRVVCLAHTTTINQRGLPPAACRDREIGVDEWPDGRGGRVKDGSLSAVLMNFRGHNGATAALDAYGRRLHRGIWNASSLTERIVCLEAAGRNLKKKKHQLKNESRRQSPRSVISQSPASTVQQEYLRRNISIVVESCSRWYIARLP